MMDLAAEILFGMATFGEDQGVMQRRDEAVTFRTAEKNSISGAAISPNS